MNVFVYVAGMRCDVGRAMIDVISFPSHQWDAWDWACDPCLPFPVPSHHDAFSYDALLGPVQCQCTLRKKGHSAVTDDQ